MTMKKRIFISNTIMVLVALLIFFGIGGANVLLFKEEFMTILEKNSQVADDMYEVRNLLSKQQNDPENWKSLSEELTKYNFNLYVSDKEKNEVYSTVHHRETECIEKLEKSENKTDKIKVYNMEGVSIAKCRMNYNGEKYSVYATYYPDQSALWGIDRGMFEMFAIVFAISGIIIIVCLLISSQMFTRFMIKRIMVPVDELNKAAKRINEQNFDEPIEYDGADEFSEVCETFNSMQKHLKENIEKSKAYEKARTEMVSGISHDLRTPLTSIKGFIKGMLDGVANTPKKQQQYLEISYKKACDMEKLLQKLFFFSKLETGNMPFFKQNTDINKWLYEYVESKLKEENYEIQYLKNDNSIIANIDVEQIRRVFDNLIENTIKYSNVEKPKIIINTKIENNNILIQFCDNGVGVSDDKIEHIFEQFYRGDESRNSKKDGSGLGLYVCKYIIEQHGGEIFAQNKEGLCVTMSLPISKEDSNA